MGQSTVTELVDFTGGMNTLVAPHLIDRRESVTLVNVDIKLGTLKSMPNLEHIEPLEDGGFFFQFDGNVYSFPNWRSNVIWDNKYYWSDGVNTGKVLQDGTELPLGIPTPELPLVQTPEAGGIHTGDFKYTYTFYSTETGVESAPAPLDDYITLSSNKVVLSGFAQFPQGANRYRIYRIGGYFSLFTLVATIELGQVPFTDNIDDTQVDGRQLETLQTGPPPQTLHNLTELNGRFYGSVDNKGYYSALGNPDAWYVNNYFVFKDKIEAIGTSPAGLLIVGKFYTSLLSGSDATNFRLKLLSDQLGCVGKESLSNIGDGSIWLSHKSFVMCNGYTIADLTSRKIDNLRNIVPTGSCVEDQTYNMSYLPALVPLDTLYPLNNLYPATPHGVSDLDKGIMVMDFKRGNNYSFKLVSYEEIVTVGIVDGDVHVGTGAKGNQYIVCDIPLFGSCLDFIACSEYALNRMNLDVGQGSTAIVYRSPAMTEQSLSTLKEYDKVRIQFIGRFKVTIFLDNRIVTEEIIENELEEFTILGIPNGKNTGYFIRFEVEGIGNMRSIQYSWKPRELVT